jgi:hypothetical protein
MPTLYANIRLFSLAALCGASLLSACGAPPAPVTPTSDPAPASSAAPMAAKPEAPSEPTPTKGADKPAETEKPAAKALPASKHTINGVSLSSVSAPDVQAVLEKAGWKVDPNGLQPKAKFGKNETFSVVAYKGPKLDKNVKTAFYFGFARQTATSDPKDAASEANFAPKKLREMYVGSNPKLVHLFDEEADVLVTISKIKGVTDAELQKLFDATVVKAK